MASAMKIEHLYLSYLHNSKPLVESDLNNFRTRLIRFVIRFLALVARIDVCGKCKSLEEEAQQQPVAMRGTFLGVRMFQQSRWWTRQGRNWLSDVVLSLYLLFNAHLLANLVYQYAYDFDKLRVARLRALVREQMVSASDFARLSIIFLDRADDSRTVLRLIGAPHRHISIAIECLYVYFVFLGLIMYYLGFLYYRLVTPFDFHFLRELLDFDDEWRHSNGLIRAEIRRFLDSDRTYFDNDLERPKRLPTDRQKPLAAWKMPDRASARPTGCSGRRGRWQELACNEYRLHEVLMHMLTSGALLPYNKSAHWVGRRLEITYLALAGMLAFTVSFAATLIGVSFYQRDKTQLLGPSELGILSSTVGLTTIICLSSTLTASTFLIAALDQLVMVRKMHELIRACKRHNETHLRLLFELKSQQCALHRLAAMGGGAPTKARQVAGSGEQRPLESACVEAMNTNLLFVFLQYKIFLGQYRPSRKTFQSVIFFAVALILLIPVIIKLHLPYLSLSNYNNAKRFAAVVSPAILVPANVVLLPVCHLDAQYIKLFRTWSSLVAHVLETESHPVGRALYDRHALSLVLKEVRHSFQFEERSRFVTAAGAVTSTYATLVKAHFWFGIGVLAILSDELPTGHISSTMSSSLFTDPFGIFSQANFLAV